MTPGVLASSRIANLGLGLGLGSSGGEIGQIRQIRHGLFREKLAEQREQR
jgi:hypothetical protein